MNTQEFFYLKDKIKNNKGGVPIVDQRGNSLSDKYELEIVANAEKSIEDYQYVKMPLSMNEFNICAFNGKVYFLNKSMIMVYPASGDPRIYYSTLFTFDGLKFNYGPAFNILNYYNSCLINFNNSLYSIGSGYSAIDKSVMRLKDDGTGWEAIYANLPYSANGNAISVVYDDKIYTFPYNSTYVMWSNSAATSWSSKSHNFRSGYYPRHGVVYNNEIHVIGTDKIHYKTTDCNSWTTVEDLSSLISNLFYISLAVYNNKIYMIKSDGYGSQSTNIYSFNGVSWAQEFHLDFDLYIPNFITFNNELYIIGSYSSPYVYKLVNNEWIKVTNNLSNITTFIDKDETTHEGNYHINKDNKTYFHSTIVPSSNQYIQYLYSYDNNFWNKKIQSSENLSISSGKKMFIYNDQIFIGGFYNNGSNKYFVNYRFLEDNQSLLSNAISTYSASLSAFSGTPMDFVIYNNEIHIFGGSTSGDERKHYKLYDLTTQTKIASVSSLPKDFKSDQCHSFIYNNEIHIIGTSDTNSGGITTNTPYHYKWNGSSWDALLAPPVGYIGTRSVDVFEDKIIVFSFGTYGYLSIFIWDGEKWDGFQMCEQLIQSGFQPSKLAYSLLNGELHLFNNDDYANYSKFGRHIVYKKNMALKDIIAERNDINIKLKVR